MNVNVPVPAVKVPPDPLVSPPIFKVLVLLFKVPAVMVQSPVKVWVKAPRFSVPPEPFIVKAPPFTFPVKVAVPAVFVIETNPVVVKPAIDCVPLPAMVIGDALAVNVPLLVKLPPRVTP